MAPSSQDEFKNIRNMRFRRWGIRLWKVSLYGLISFVMFLILLSFDNLPSFSDLEDPTNNLASPIYANKGELIGSYFIENRIPIEYKDLPKHLIDALVSTEDSRFYIHSGIDPEALMRVFTKTIIMGEKSSGGGSTITQQLAKLLYSDRDFSGMTKTQKLVGLITRKFKEMITAVKLEKRYTKNEILSLYLNHFNFINGAYGIKAASEIYFGKSPKDLKVEESATLVGMLQNPSLFNPLRRPEKVRQRRNAVLKKMEKAGKLTHEEFLKYSARTIDLSNFSLKNPSDGIAPYFRMELRKEVLRILDRPECRKSDGKTYNIYKDGLKIYTTLDTAIQNCSEAAVADHMKSLQKTFFSRWKGKDPWTFVKPKRSEPYTSKKELEEGEVEVKPKTVEEEIAFRARMLWSNVQSSERYAVIRSKILSNLISEIQDEYESIRLSDSDIERMILFQTDKEVFKRLIKKRYLQKEKAAVYEEIIKSSYWAKLKSKYESLQKEALANFNTPVKMKVFAYNSTMEKDTVMKPIDSIKYHRMFLQTGMVTIEPTTGYVKSWVGGINYKYFQYDHVTSERQVGSTFKPFIYATAIAMQGFSPCFQVQDVAQTIKVGEGTFKIDRDWTPKNFDYYSGKYYTLKEALKKSINTVSVFLMKQIGDTEPVRGLIHNMGIDSSARRDNGVLRIPKEPSICLGTPDLSVMEMTGAYATFANEGKYLKPIIITRIEDKNGKIIFQETPLEKVALSPVSDYVMVEMLRHVASGSGGFGNVRSTFGGKTGTTNDAADGWFMGINPQLVAGIWVGGEDKWITFLDTNEGQGSFMARPMFAKFLENIEKNQNVDYDPSMQFKRPEGEINIELDCYKYQLSGIETSNSSKNAAIYEDPFDEGSGKSDDFVE